MHKNAYSLYKSDNASLVVIIFTFHPSEFSRKATLYLLISSNKEKKKKKVRFFFFCEIHGRGFLSQKTEP